MAYDGAGLPGTPLLLSPAPRSCPSQQPKQILSQEAKLLQKLEKKSKIRFFFSKFEPEIIILSPYLRLYLWVPNIRNKNFRIIYDFLSPLNFYFLPKFVPRALTKHSADRKFIRPTFFSPCPRLIAWLWGSSGTSWISPCYWCSCPAVRTASPPLRFPSSASTA